MNSFFADFRYIFITKGRKVMYKPTDVTFIFGFQLADGTQNEF